MQKDTDASEPYAVSISDWISILQDKIRYHFDLYIFIITAIIGMIIVAPQLERDAMGSNIIYTGIVLIPLLGLLYWVYKLMDKKSEEINKPYKDLYNKIIYGEISDPVKIKDLYKEIEEKNNDENSEITHIAPQLGKSKISINFTPKLNIVIATILFLIIDILLIASTKLDNLITLALVNSIFVIHIILWLHVGDFKIKENLVKGYATPLVFIIIFFSIVLLINALITCNGIIWTYSTIILGMIPLILITLYTAFALIKDGQLTDEFFIKRGRKRGNIFFFTWTISIIMLLLIIMSPLIINGLNYTIRDNNQELHSLVNNLTKNSHNDTEKTLSLLSWFDSGYGKKENISDIYKREHEKDNEILLKVGDDFIYIFSKEPNFCTRLDEKNDMWIFASRCGRCGEFSTLFNTMSIYANLTTRKVECDGEDHAWNEVLINISGNESWIVVDSTAVNLPDGKGFDLPRNFMEEKIKGDLRAHNIIVDEGNVSFVYAIYTDAPNKKVDITDRYTNLTNITVFTVDKNNQPLGNVTVDVYSNNRLIQRYTGLTNTTNDEGIHTFTMGGGNYTFKASINNFYGENTSSFIEKEPNHNITIELNNRN